MFNYYSTIYIKYSNYLRYFLKKYIFGNENRLYIFSILFSILSIIGAIIYINKFVIKIKEKTT